MPHPAFRIHKKRDLNLEWWLYRFASVLLVFLLSTTGAAEEPTKGTADGYAVVDQISLPPDCWPWWRGPSRQGEVRDQHDYPLKWSETENILWKTPLPGRGHSSPILWQTAVILTTAEESTGDQWVIRLDAQTGKTVWKKRVHAGGALQKNTKASAASSSAATDGKRIYVNFPNDNAVYTTALDFDGQQIWQTKITKYQVHQGYGSSPALYRTLVIVSADNKAGGVLAALDRQTGKIVWSHDRPKTPNYPSPILLRLHGRDQVLMTGCDLVTSLDPLTGKVLWETEGATTECVTSTVTDGAHIFSSGGYPQNHVSAIRADGSGEVVWRSRDRVYVPSLLCKEGTLFGVLDAGVAMCWNSADGKPLWKARLGGTVSASPVLVRKRIYSTNEKGMTHIFAASADGFKKLAENKLAGEVFATPTFCGGKIYYRVARRENGKRQEFLYCIATKN